MENVRVKVSGNHINELSENIPSNIFALNELIKNSYDACASYCEIKIDAKNNLLTIEDNGKGLEESSINELFHLSRSSKKFGTKKKCKGVYRRVQGSKGLGFLAAFRFGDFVTWDTSCSTDRYVFSARKSELTSEDDISKHVVDVSRLEPASKGTKITINLDQSVVDELNSYFSNAANHLKLVGAIQDDTFEIILRIGGQIYRTSSLPQLKDINPSDQLFYVKYSSVNEEVEIYRNGYLEKKMKVGLSSNQYQIDLSLMIYNLESYGKKRINQYFYKPKDSSITPLVFINDNLFNNYEIFDTDIFRSRRSKSALPQMIGYVKVYSSSEYFEFNSDRTNFVENPVTSALMSDLLNLNEKIQAAGSDLKSVAKLKNQKYTGPAFPKLGASGSRKPLVKAKIETSSKDKIISIPSKQINVFDYVLGVSNSNGDPVAVGDLEVFIDNGNSNGIIPSISAPCKKIITYEFDDPNTGRVVEKVELIFEEKKASIAGSGVADDLFYITGSSKNYYIQLKNVAKLMEQISDANRRGRFRFLIACSLRTIFELSNNAVNNDLPHIFSHEFKSRKKCKAESTNKVIQLVHFLKNNKRVTTEIAKELGLSFTSVLNILDVDMFQKQFELSNVGAHSGEQYLTVDIIEGIAKFSGFYAAFCDVLLHKIDKKLIDAAIIVDI